MKKFREFWIARIKDYDCISDIKPPENAMHKDKYIRVVAVDDLQFEIGMGLTRYSQVMKELKDANESIAELESSGLTKEYQALQIENEEFRQKIKELEAEIEILTAQRNGLKISFGIEIQELKDKITQLEKENKSILFNLDIKGNSLLGALERERKLTAQIAIATEALEKIKLVTELAPDFFFKDVATQALEKMKAVK